MSKISSYFHREKVGSSTKNTKSENVPVQPGKIHSQPDAAVALTSKPRQTLGTLQSAADRGLTRPEEKLFKAKKIVAQPGVKVYEDRKRVTQDEEVQTEVSGAACPQCVAHSTPVKQLSPEEEAHRLMVQDEPPLEYWKTLAEERRSALEDSLIENEQLHSDIKFLQDENERLTDSAKDAEYFAEVLKSLTSTEEGEAAASLSASSGVESESSEQDVEGDQPDDRSQANETTQ